MVIGEELLWPYYGYDPFFNYVGSLIMAVSSLSNYMRAIILGAACWKVFKLSGFVAFSKSLEMVSV